MPSKSPLLRLYDIRDNARLAQEWTATHTCESFEADQLLFYAVTRSLEIVSEASRRIPQEIRDRHPELPWQKIMGVGNVYRREQCGSGFPLCWQPSRKNRPGNLARAKSGYVRGGHRAVTGFHAA